MDLNLWSNSEPKQSVEEKSPPPPPNIQQKYTFFKY